MVLDVSTRLCQNLLSHKCVYVVCKYAIIGDSVKKIESSLSHDSYDHIKKSVSLLWNQVHCGSFAEKDSGVVDMSHSVALLWLFVMLMSLTDLIQGSQIACV